MKVDVIIPVLSRDLDVFLWGYNYIFENLPCKKIILIGDEQIEDKIKEIQNVFFINENTLVEGLNLSEIKAIKKRVSNSKRRAGWYFQQFLKIGYARICEDDYYLIWDADTIPINKIEMFDSNGQPYIAYRNFVASDKCFNATQDRLLPNNSLHKTEHRSYIAEHLLVDVSVMNELLDRIESNNEITGDFFFEKIMYSIPRKVINVSGFSEFELYAAYVLKYHPNLYIQRKWKNLRNAKTFIGCSPNSIDLKWISKEFDVVSVEDFCSFWVICRILKYIDPQRKIKFKTVYKIINPLYIIVSKLRFFLRNIIKK